MKRRTVQARNRAAAADYRAAALRIEQGMSFACCFALEAACAVRRDAARLSVIMCDFYEGGLVPGRRLGFWMAEVDECSTGADPVVQDRRVLALCFMATLAEAGDL